MLAWHKSKTQYMVNKNIEKTTTEYDPKGSHKEAP